MPAQEQELFGNRLNKALIDAGFNKFGPSRVAREFNGRFPHLRVSVHAVRKWLLGEAIPTQARVIALAAWLGVPPVWLRFNGGVHQGGGQLPKADNAERLLIRDYMLLDEHNKWLAQNMVSLLLKSMHQSRKDQPDQPTLGRSDHAERLNTGDAPPPARQQIVMLWPFLCLFLGGTKVKAMLNYGSTSP